MINKAIDVIHSCETPEQLRAAERYCTLMFRKFNRDGVSLSSAVKWAGLIERHVGYMQCKVSDAK